MDKKLINFNLEADLSISLSCLSDAISKIRCEHEGYFKWAIIYAHNSLQTSMCLALITTNSCLVRKRDSYNKEFGELDNVEWLYTKLQNPDFLTYMGSKALPADVNGDQLIKRLQKIRNTFIHQQPSLYVFTTDELYELLDFSVKIIRFLVSKSGRMALVNGTMVIEKTLDQIEMQLTKPSTRCL